MKLDYSALAQPATNDDVETYKAAYPQRGLVIPNGIRNPLLVVSCVMLVGIFVLIFTGNVEEIMLPVQLFIVTVVVVAFIEASKYKIKRRAKIYKFALANGAKLRVDVPEPAYTGAIFDDGHSRSITDALVLADGTEIGNYTYTTGSGKNRSEHHWGYAHIKLSRRLPHMLLDAKSNNIFGKISNLPASFASQTLSLEGDFDKHFKLYVPDNYQRDAFYVLTPDVMAAMIDAGKNYDIEIIDDELFIYGSVIDLSLQSSLEPLIGIIDTIGDELRDQSKNYSDERAPNRAANIVAEPGRRLKSRLGVVQIVFYALLSAFFVYIIMSNAS